MKNSIKFFGIIVFITVIIFSIVACNVGTSNSSNVSTTSITETKQQYTFIKPGTLFFGVGNAWYQVTVSAGTLTAYTGGDFLDTVMAIYDSSGKMLARDDDSGEGRNAKISLTVSAGTYYIAVVSYDTKIVNGPYVLHVEAQN
jgi:hypothetical protein